MQRLPRLRRFRNARTSILAEWPLARVPPRATPLHSCGTASRACCIRRPPVPRVHEWRPPTVARPCATVPAQSDALLHPATLSLGTQPPAFPHSLGAKWLPPEASPHPPATPEGVNARRSARVRRGGRRGP